MGNIRSLHRRGLMLLCPRRYYASVTEIDVEELRRAGITAVLLDLDNTLVGWQRCDVLPEIRVWLRSLKEAGMKLCLVTNTRPRKRLQALSQELEIPYVPHPWKPRKKGFIQAMQELGVDSSKTIMIGDQMFTDVLGGNRAGVSTLLVRPLTRREFIGTKVSRVVEKVLLSLFRRHGYL
jgi:HAD superfamily phosphatase (TIGR01668 family)